MPIIFGSPLNKILLYFFQILVVFFHANVNYGEINLQNDNKADRPLFAGLSV